MAKAKVHKYVQENGFLHELNKNKVLFIMMLPALIILLINNYLPMAGVLIAFKNYQYKGRNVFENFFLSDWVGFKNFEFLFKTPDAFIITRNTILYNAAFIVVGLVMAVSFAIVLNELSAKKLSKVYQSTMLFPYFFSWTIVMYLVFAFLSEESGFFNRVLLPALGLEPKMWYLDGKLWPFILVFVYLWKSIGYNCVVYLAAIAGIDGEFYEAATIDGASKWQQITKITLPLLSPLITILTLLSIGRIFYADFGLFFNVTRNAGALYDYTNVIDLYVYNGLRNLGDVGMSSAAGLYQASLGFVFVLGSNLLVRKLDPEKSLF